MVENERELGTASHWQVNELKRSSKEKNKKEFLPDQTFVEHVHWMNENRLLKRIWEDTKIWMKEVSKDMGELGLTTGRYEQQRNVHTKRITFGSIT